MTQPTQRKWAVHRLVEVQTDKLGGQVRLALPFVSASTRTRAVSDERGPRPIHELNIRISVAATKTKLSLNLSRDEATPLITVLLRVARGGERRYRTPSLGCSGAFRVSTWG
jgi:hypothetical protein